MPRTRKPKQTAVPDAVLDHFAGPARVITPTEVEDAIRRYKKALVERALGAELTHHIGYPPGAPDAPRRASSISFATVSRLPATGIGRPSRTP